MVEIGDDTPDLVGSTRDPAFLRSVRPLLQLYAAYFRSEVRGFDRLPERGPFLVVGNHSGGQMPPDIPVLLTAWWRERGEDEPIYALFHQFLLGIPGVGRLLKRAGAIDAGPIDAEAILRGNGILIDYPGGDYEVFRPWWERNRIEFGERLGFIRLALRTQVPIIPAVSVGSHETLVVLSRGQSVAKHLGIDRLFRIKVMPLVVRAAFRDRSGRDPDMATSCKDHRRAGRTDPLARTRSLMPLTTMRSYVSATRR